MTDLWNKDADPIELGDHYATAVDLLTTRGVFGKGDVATVIALHSAEIERLREILTIIVTNAKLQPDASMAGATDCYAVPLDDIEEARSLVASPLHAEEK